MRAEDVAPQRIGAATISIKKRLGMKNGKSFYPLNAAVSTPAENPGESKGTMSCRTFQRRAAGDKPLQE